MDEQLLRETRRIKPTNNSNVYDQLLDSYQMMSKEELMNRMAKIEMNKTQMLPSTGTALQREVDDGAVSIGSGFGCVPVPDSKSKMQKENKRRRLSNEVPPKSPNRKRVLAEHTETSNKKGPRSEQKQTPAPKRTKQAIRQPLAESPPKERSLSPTSSLDVYSVSGYSIRGAPPPLKRRSPRQPMAPPLTHKLKGRLISEWAQEQRERCSSGDFEEDENVKGLQRNVRQVMAGCKRRHHLKLIGY